MVQQAVSMVLVGRAAQGLPLALMVLVALAMGL
jgi:hypothetical protein